jgi:DNA-binding CsgD family transcriptional regulator/tetratricopeptide (TPR) repeat protein
MAASLARARDSFLRHAWKQAYDGLLAELERLGADDLERLAVSAHLVGRTLESDDAWARAYHRRLDDGDIRGAARCAFWLAFRLVNAAERAETNAWVARLERLVAAAPDDMITRARLDYLTGLRAVLEGEFVASAADLRRSAETATSQGDDELAALARLALGRVRIFRGDITAGTRLLDDAMLVVGSEQMSPIAVGDGYCTAIDACHDLFDLRRGQVWTDGLTRWCDRQPDLVPFAGICQVHRSEFLQLKGQWADAMAQAGLAKARLDRPLRQLAYGAAAYQQGELHRLLGKFGRAQECYREASAAGRDPQPGLALMRLRQGRTDEAARAIDRAVSEAGDPVRRAPLLAAYVEIMLAADRPAEAESAASDLADIAASLRSPMLDAVSRRAAGWVRLAQGRARDALADLRTAGDGFRDLDAPYEVACTALLIGTARAALGDAEGAALEIEVARATFARLGAGPDLARVPGHAAPGLTAREVQVLRLVVQGQTNRSIGIALGLSERTVDRHVSNIFAKLGVSSRTAATAVAFRSQLI